ncbi:unnamed protein product [Microthlaspi erraticum]|uniref:Uncharacterized protein n=1 Tax=Microthlaspi erraticum TaxID=1685480 RepID=A0A6D2LH54_9BRAS|nr:unnamed protein product [Microthlaspi erraticum]
MDGDEYESHALYKHIANCRHSISRWKKSNPTNSAKMIEAIKAQLETAQTHDTAPSSEVKKVLHDVRNRVKTTLGITKDGGMGMYLSIPEQLSGSKAQVFSYIQEQLNGNINSWSAKLLSKGGKEIQIKSVAQAFPTYVMFCFLLPKGIINKLCSAISRIWWSTKVPNGESGSSVANRANLAEQVVQVRIKRI